MLHFYRGVCLSTLRGHADAVNDAAFLPFSNALATCSADKSVSLWDIRTASEFTMLLNDYGVVIM